MDSARERAGRRTGRLAGDGTSSAKLERLTAGSAEGRHPGETCDLPEVDVKANAPTDPNAPTPASCWIAELIKMLAFAKAASNARATATRT
jgi:hypothetical protein